MAERENGFEELARVWREQSLDSEVRDGKEVLMQVREKVRRFDRSVFWRDVREVAAGGIAAFTMGGASWLAPGVLPKLGGLVMLACIGYVLARMLAARRAYGHAPQADRPLTERLRVEIDKADAQAELLRSVGTWYVLPLAAGATIWAVTLVPSLPLPAGALVPALAIMVAASLAIFGFVGWVVRWLNRRGLERQLDPYRRELRTLLEREFATEGVSPAQSER